MLRLIKLYLLLTIVLFTSCRNHKDLIYFQNLENYPDPAIYNVIHHQGPSINYGDILAINIYSFDPRASEPFNTQVSSTDDRQTAVSAVPEYLVDEEGTINFPVLGQITVIGKTQKELEKLLTDQLKEGYIKKPVVDVRLMNFRIVILGEAGNGILEIPSNKINIIEALALAGDISIYGDRKNILLVRENNDKREFARLDVTDAGIFNSPYFNLQNNDILYLEPLKYKTADANQERVSRNLSFATALVSLITFFTIILGERP